jgi:hypothetical protein
LPDDAPDPGRIHLQLVFPDSGDADASRAYANHIRVSPAQHDFTMRFGWFAIPVFSAEDPPSGQVDVPVHDVATLTLPLNIVPLLVSLLTEQIRVWEANFGQEFPQLPQRAVGRPVVREVDPQ